MDDAGGVRVQGPAAPSGGYLSLLANERKLAIMQALTHLARPAAEFADMLGISERRARAHLGMLREHGLVGRVRSVSPSHRVAWALSDAGRELLGLHELILDCERRLRSADLAAAGSRPLIQTICYAHVRAIVWVLANDPHTLAQLERELEWIPRSTLAHGLERACQSGVAQARGTSARPRYELRGAARGPLALIAVAGVCWRQRFTPERRPWNAGDLLGLLVLLAPVVRVSAPGVHGTCLMQAVSKFPRSADAVRWPDALVSVLRGRIAPRAAGPTQAQSLDARLTASEEDWCEALLTGAFERIEIDGDEKLAHALLDALARALHA